MIVGHSGRMRKLEERAAGVRDLEEARQLKLPEVLTDLQLGKLAVNSPARDSVDAGGVMAGEAAGRTPFSEELYHKQNIYKLDGSVEDQ